MSNPKHFSVEAINGPDHEANRILKQMYSALLDKSDLSVFEQSIFQAIEEAYKSKNDQGQLNELLEYLLKNLKSEPQTSRDHELNFLIKNALISVIKKTEEHESVEDKIAEMAYAMSNRDFSYRLPQSDIDSQNEKYDFVAICLNATCEDIQSSMVPIEVAEILLSRPTNFDLIVTDNEGVIRFISSNLKKRIFSKERVKLGGKIEAIQSIEFKKALLNEWIMLENISSSAIPKVKTQKAEVEDFIIYEIDLE